MATSAQWIADIKQKKSAMASFFGVNKSNHPHRMTAVDLTGALTYTIDEKAFTVNLSPSNGAVAYVYSYDLTITGITGYTRLMEPRQPWSASPPSGLAVGEFALAHQPRVKFWEMLMQFGTYPDYEVVGTLTRDRYVYNSGSWAIDTTATTDIEAAWDFNIAGGGDPNSGGKDDESDDENALVSVTIDWTGDYSSNIPDVSISGIKRFPWDDSWASESAAFFDLFDDEIAARNVTDGSGHSGTCTISLDFA